MTTNRHPSEERAARQVQHVRDLCAAFKVRLVVRRRGMRPDQAGAGFVAGSTTRKAIIITPVIDDTTYAVALHEIGHCEAAFGMVGTGSRRARTRRDVLLTLEQEDAAWAWARHYALDWSEYMSQVERMSRESYAEWARVALRIIDRVGRLGNE